ncbi:MAG: hypothetical protein AB8F78_11350 [Saprospiraceae bacterium]
MVIIEEIIEVNKVVCLSPEIIWQGNTVLVDREVVFEGAIALVDLFNGLLLIQTDQVTSHIIQLDSRAEFEVDGGGTLISDSHVLLGKWNSNFSERTLFGWDFRKGAEVWTSNSYFGSPVVYGEMLFGHLKAHVFRIGPNTGKPIWSLDVSRFGSEIVNGKTSPISILDYIGVSGGNLFVRLGSKIIIGICLEKGVIGFEYKLDSDILVLDNLQIDDDNGSIFSIGPMNFFEIAISNMKSELISLSDDLVGLSVDATRMGSRIGALVSFWQGSSSSQFGVFDKSTMKVKATGAIGNEVVDPIGVQDVKCDRGRLYVLGFNSVLYIFSWNSDRC